MDPKEIEWETVKLIYLDMDMDNWRDFVDVGSKNVKNFLTQLATIEFCFLRLVIAWDKYAISMPELIITAYSMPNEKKIHGTYVASSLRKYPFFNLPLWNAYLMNWPLLLLINAT
jgi:hypothetical protein